MSHIRHVIVEGMDGTGKTNLVNYLLQAFPMLTPHPRASTSTGGPVPELDWWVINDTTTTHRAAPSVYDRHPIISEPIYGPVCRGKVPGRFNDARWVADMKRRLALASVMILCAPPWDTVKANLENEDIDHMEGVRKHAHSLYMAYAWVDWPGIQIRYDYSRHSKDMIADYMRSILGGVFNDAR